MPIGNQRDFSQRGVFCIRKLRACIYYKVENERRRSICISIRGAARREVSRGRRGLEVVNWCLEIQ